MFIEKQEATSIGVSSVSLFLGRPLLLAGEGRVSLRKKAVSVEELPMFVIVCMSLFDNRAVTILIFGAL